MTDSEILENIPAVSPVSRLVWTAIVDVADRQDLGPAAGGHRFIVPILGGRFYAGPAFDGLSGAVLPGGADRQFLRADGVKELDALYEMQIEGGPVITVRNRVIVDETRKPERYAMSAIQARVEEGPFGWLNRRLLIGTLLSARPGRQAVIIRAWEVDTPR
ncbi:DUF3237 family protein [Thalassovita sp.]|jgi:hypothetical protein|uniref:DUF3237 family protein n=1 Tax=Thalassovita sp. TaxID=1979401 RepID=UPI003B5B8A38